MKNLTNILNTIAREGPPLEGPPPRFPIDPICNCSVPACLGETPTPGPPPPGPPTAPLPTPVRDLRLRPVGQCFSIFEGLLEKCNKCEKQEDIEACKARAIDWDRMCRQGKDL